MRPTLQSLRWTSCLASTRKNSATRFTAKRDSCELPRQPARLIGLNKPYGVLSQFTDTGERQTLASLVSVPEVYPAGRLDRDSEGLLLLTDDGRLQARIADPRHKLDKTYLVEVEREPDEQALRQLRAGVWIDQRRTRPASVRRIDKPQWLWPRVPPVRFRKSVPTLWLEVIISEGRNRQVRRMCASVDHPVLRLVRTRIGPWGLGGLAGGQWQELDASLLG
ncbi:MAG: 23S rRNA pseudouridine2457 synthase [Gammaproteobacteria bacterium]|jgi:23S rRNA pseudouridine2457 synthase